MTATTPNNPRFELTFSPSVVLISVVRQFVSSFYSVVLEKDATERVAMATHEMLENALRYGNEEGATLRISIDRQAGNDIVTIQIRNRSTPDQITGLQEVVARLQDDEDRTLRYVSLLRDASKHPESSSGLAIARVWAETDMAISLDVNGSEVTLTARSAIERRGAQ